MESDVISYNPFRLCLLTLYLVTADPFQVRWDRMGGGTIDPQHHVQRHEGATYSLSIDKVKDSDMGIYVCRARNTMGSADATIELTGQSEVR